MPPSLVVKKSSNARSSSARRHPRPGIGHGDPHQPIAVARRGLGGDRDGAVRAAGEAVHRVADQVLEDPSQHQAVGCGMRKIRREHASVTGAAARHLLDHRIHVAWRAIHCGREPGIVAGQRVEVGETRVERPLPLLEHPGERRRIVARHLVEMPEHVANGGETVLDVVVHLPGEVAHRDAALRVTKPRGAESQPIGHRAQESRERADLVGSRGREVLIEAVEIDRGRLLGQLGERPVDSRREPRGEKEREPGGGRGREETPRCDAPPERFERRGRSGHDQPRGVGRGGAVDEVEERHRHLPHHRPARSRTTWHPGSRRA